MRNFNYNKIMQEKAVVHCETEEQAKELLEWANSKGLKWCNGKSYISNDGNYDTLCYNLMNGTKSRERYYSKNGHTILKFSDVVIEEEKKFPRKMLVSNNNSYWLEGKVLYVHGLSGSCLCENPDDANSISIWRHCKELPEVSKTRPMAHAEVFKAIHEGAVVRGNAPSNILNFWCTGYSQEDFEICYNYTGNDSDIWERMEVEE